MNLKAFTIIEILISLLIIGLLAATISIGFSNSQKKSRDARRMDDWAIFRNAFDIYYLENSRYTKFGTEVLETSIGCYYRKRTMADIGLCFLPPESYYKNYGNWSPTWGEVKEVLLDSGILNKLPVDPVNYYDSKNFKNSYFYVFYYRSTYQTYFEWRFRYEDSNKAGQWRYIYYPHK